MATNEDKISTHENGVHTNGGHSEETNGQGTHTCVKTGLDEIVLIDELPGETWSLGTTIRPNGDAFIPRLNGPELYTVRTSASHSQPFSKTEPRLIHSFTDTTSVFNICRLKTTEREEYAVLTAFVNVETMKVQNAVVWRLVPPADDSAESEVTKIASIPGSQVCVCMIAVSERVLLIGDSSGGCLYHLDIETGASYIFHDDESMRAATKKEALGLGGIYINGNYLFYTNTSRGTLSCLPIDWTEDRQNLELAGPSRIIADGLSNADGLVVTKDGCSAYLGSFTSGTLWKVDLDLEAGTSVTHILRERMPNPTAMELVYSEQNQEPTLFMVCCGFVDQEWRDSVGSRWLGMFHVDTSIMVTTETLITYEPNPDYIPAENRD